MLAVHGTGVQVVIATRGPLVDGRVTPWRDEEHTQGIPPLSRYWTSNLDEVCTRHSPYTGRKPTSRTKSSPANCNCARQTSWSLHECRPMRIHLAPTLLQKKLAEEARPTLYYFDSAPPPGGDEDLPVRAQAPRQEQVSINDGGSSAFSVDCQEKRPVKVCTLHSMTARQSGNQLGVSSYKSNWLE